MSTFFLSKYTIFLTSHFTWNLDLGINTRNPHKEKLNLLTKLSCNKLAQGKINELT